MSSTIVKMSWSGRLGALAAKARGALLFNWIFALERAALDASRRWVGEAVALLEAREGATAS